MSSLAELPELVGFFSYSREDDEDAHGSLSALRDRINRELRSRLGRSRAEFRLWQDKAAIPHGALWEEEIKSAIAQSVFFIPIVTPSTLRSKRCKFEFEMFLAREAELNRRDLIFPILYIQVPALEEERLWRQHAVLNIVGSRQYFDWQPMRFLHIDSPEVAKQVERFCDNIFKALSQPWLTPEERRQNASAEAARHAPQQEARPQTKEADAPERDAAAAAEERDGIVPASAPTAATEQAIAANGARTDARQAKKTAKAATRTPTWLVPSAVAVACLAGLGIATFAYLKIVRPSAPQVTSQSNSSPSAPAVVAQSKTAPQPAPRQAEALVPETIPIVSDRVRENIRNEYLPASDHKALAISTGPIGFITGQPDDETAKTAALDICQQRANALTPPRRCELYAVGTMVVYAGGYPPMPPTPWFTLDPSIEKPLVSKDIPLLADNNKTMIEKNYLPGKTPKALAISSSGAFGDYYGQQSDDEAVRRALELCGITAGVPCMIVAVDDDFVVPIPMTMKAVGFFRPAGAVVIASELRNDLARRLGNGSGWTAVAAGASGKFGLMLKAVNEQVAVDGAMADCAKQDISCRVIAIGPFAVEPK